MSEFNPLTSARLPAPAIPLADIVITIDNVSFLNADGESVHGNIRIEYMPDRWLLSTNTLADYTSSFQSQKALPEHIIAAVGHDLVQIIEPKQIAVVGEFTVGRDMKVRPVFVWQKTESLATETDEKVE